MQIRMINFVIQLKVKNIMKTDEVAYLADSRKNKNCNVGDLASLQLLSSDVQSILGYTETSL